jgi:hypothetical protein
MKIDGSVKPPWCKKLKILTLFMGIYGRNESMRVDTQLLERVVNECRREVRSLEFIRLCGPSPISFDWNHVIGVSVAMIQMSTKHADFEIALHLCPGQL